MSLVTHETRLTDVAEINPRVLLDSIARNDSVAFVPMAAMSAEHGVVTSTENRIVADMMKGFTPFHDGDVLIAKITPCFENGKIGQVRIPTSIGFGSTEFHVVRPTAGKLDGRYLHHFLRQSHIRDAGEKRMTGSAGQRRVPTDFVAELRLYLPPLAEQRRIADILDKADALRAQRRAALAELDTLTQSTFLDLFGDPIENPKGIRIAKLLDACRRVTDGTHQSPKWSASGHPFLFISNIVTGEITFDTQKFVSDETYSELTRRCPIEIGDVLYSTVGSYGVPAVVRTNDKFAFQRHIAHIKPQPEVLDSEFLRAMLASPPLKIQADKAARGIAQKTVNLADIKEFVIFTPPLEDQQDFAHRITAIESLKSRHRAALVELDTLFASLQHRAFRGEL